MNFLADVVLVVLGRKRERFENERAVGVALLVAVGWTVFLYAVIIYAVTSAP